MDTELMRRKPIMGLLISSFTLIASLLLGCLEEPPAKQPLSFVPTAGNGTYVTNVNTNSMIIKNLTTNGILVFNEGKYSIKVGKVLDGCPDNVSVIYSINKTKLKDFFPLCRGGMTWLSPEGRGFYIEMNPAGPYGYDDRYPPINETEVTIYG